MINNELVSRTVRVYSRKVSLEASKRRSRTDKRDVKEGFWRDEK
jgi:hypothetical protein